MKIILTGATGVLGSHIMYEILELFIKSNHNGKLFIIARNKGNRSALERIDELLSSYYTPTIIKEKGISHLHQYLEIIDADLATIQPNFSAKIEGAYFIHSAGFVNLSTDESQRSKIYDENTTITKSLFTLFQPFIKKFIYIGTAFSSGNREGLIENDFHTLGFIPDHRNAYENAKYDSEIFIASACKKVNLPFQILRPSVIGGKMLGDENPNFISKYMVFYLLAKFFYLTSHRKGVKENVRFVVNKDTVLNIIPVDYVAKVIVKTFERSDIEQLNIVHNKSFNMMHGLDVIMKEVGYTNFTSITNPLNFTYLNTIEKLYYESIGKHLNPYFTSRANEYDTTLLQTILEIPILDDQVLTDMIRFAKSNNFKDINV